MKYGYDIAPAAARNAVINNIDINSAHSMLFLYEYVSVKTKLHFDSHALLWNM